MERETNPAATRVVPARFTRIFRQVTEPVLLPAGIYARIAVPGRNSGEERVVTLTPISHDGSWYLCSFSGQCDWVSNLRSAGRATITRRGHTAVVRVIEVDGEERARVQATYRRNMGPMRRDFNRLPNAGDHPTFRLEPSATEG